MMAAVLDVLPHGRPGDDRPQHQKEPLAYALDIDEFYRYELQLRTRMPISRSVTALIDEFGRVTEVEFEDIPSGARSELDYAVEDIVEANEQRFVDFYNDAQPITLRLHQLNLLPGIGKKLRNTILDERKRSLRELRRPRKARQRTPQPQGDACRADTRRATGDDQKT